MRTPALALPSRPNTWLLAALTSVAVVVIALTAWRVDAAPGSSDSNVVTITPVRVLDTRDGNDVGLPGPFASGVAQRLTVTGLVATSNGTATVVPAGATGVLLNVTTLNSTSGGVVSIRPGTATGDPATSNINFTAGQVLANAVTVALPAADPNAGEIDIFFRGDGDADRTDLLIDVVGYIATAPPGPMLAGVEAPTVELADGETAVVATLDIDAPAAGSAVVDASAAVSDRENGGKIFCSITTGTTVGTPTLTWESAGEDGSIGQLAGSRNLPVTSGPNAFRLVCQSVASDGGMSAFVTAPTMTLVYVAS